MKWISLLSALLLLGCSRQYVISEKSNVKSIECWYHVEFMNGSDTVKIFPCPRCEFDDETNCFFGLSDSSSSK